VITIRAATHQDLPALMPLWRELETAQGAYRLYPPVPEAQERIIAAFRAGIDSDDADVLVAYDGDEAVGMVLVHLERPSRMSDERAAELSRVVVRADRRGSGAGKALVQASETWARDRGIRTMVAAIFVRNEPSRGFWRAVGFEPWVERMVREVRPDPGS
jgi:GNAT superfamily N-acetyltransferase